ncbi:hypothetical protein, partial [Haladaptatus sp. NG-WS-4]
STYSRPITASKTVFVSFRGLYRVRRSFCRCSYRESGQLAIVGISKKFDGGIDESILDEYPRETLLEQVQIEFYQHAKQEIRTKKPEARRVA